jgi:anti-sigma regulatory factor (Ser/Thr protein kinase)
MLPTFQRTITADLESLHRLQRELVVFLESSGVPTKASHDAQVVCEELIVNAIRHGLGPHAGAHHRIDVSIILGVAIAIRIGDDLPLFDPTSAPSPVPASSLASAPTGGRGLTLVRRVTTLFRWHAEGGQNVIDVEIPIGRR